MLPTPRPARSQPLWTPAAVMPLPVAARDPGERLLLLGVRVWAGRRRAGRTAKDALVSLLGMAAPALVNLLEAWAETMPYPPAALPCGAQAVSPDEALLLDLVAAAAREDRDAAETLLRDLLPAAHRARLFALAGRAALLLPAS